MNAKAVKDFIAANWDSTIRLPTGCGANELPLVAPFTVPTAGPAFRFFFYRDTYFTNVGLLLDGRAELARGNADNFVHLIETHGCMPNYTRSCGLNRSQPPVASQAIREVYERTGDKDWLRKAYQALGREHAFWMAMRLLPCGLNRHYHHAVPAYVHAFAEGVRSRLPPPEEPGARLAFANHSLAEAETGWDFNPRFERRCGDFAPIDLNSLLYQMETNLAWFASELGVDAAEWLSRAEARKRLVNERMWDEDRGAFYDYDSAHDRRGPILSVAVFFPLWTGLATNEQARRVVAHLKDLEYEHGVTTCVPGPRDFAYQWDHPNGWPPMQFVAIEGLRRYGYREEATRLAEKYVATVCRNFDRTGNLWEKYNVATGGIDVQDEYAMPPMLGWTAGVFLHCCSLLDGK